MSSLVAQTESAGVLVEWSWPAQANLHYKLPTFPPDNANTQ